MSIGLRVKRQFGECSDFTGLSSNVSLFKNSRRIIYVTGQSAGLSITLPDATTLKKGGPHFYIINADATNSILIKSFGGATLLTLYAGYSKSLYLVDNSTSAGVWLWKTKILLQDALGANAYSIVSSFIYLNRVHALNVQEWDYNPAGFNDGAYSGAIQWNPHTTDPALLEIHNEDADLVNTWWSAGTDKIFLVAFKSTRAYASWGARETFGGLFSTNPAVINCVSLEFSKSTGGVRLYYIYNGVVGPTITALTLGSNISIGTKVVMVAKLTGTGATRTWTLWVNGVQEGTSTGGYFHGVVASFRIGWGFNDGGGFFKYPTNQPVAMYGLLEGSLSDADCLALSNSVGLLEMLD